MTTPTDIDALVARLKHHASHICSPDLEDLGQAAAALTALSDEIAVLTRDNFSLTVRDKGWALQSEEQQAEIAVLKEREADEDTVRVAYVREGELLIGQRDDEGRRPCQTVPPQPVLWASVPRSALTDKAGSK